MFLFWLDSLRRWNFCSFGGGVYRHALVYVHLFLTVLGRIHGLSCLRTVLIPPCVQGWSPLIYLKRACCLSEAVISRLPPGLYVWTLRGLWYCSISCSEQLLDHRSLCSLREKESVTYNPVLQFLIHEVSRPRYSLLRPIDSAHGCLGGKETLYLPGVPIG